MPAFDSTFSAPIPGSSIGHHKLGELPHEKPPEYTDPHEALDYFWKLLIQPKIQRQIWDILKLPDAHVSSVARAILFKAALNGIIQMNLGMVIYPIVQQMVNTIAKAGGVNASLAPKTTSPQREKYIKDGLKELLVKYDKKGWLTGAAQEDNAQSQPPVAAEGEAEQQPQQASGIMGMAQQPQSPDNGEQ